MSHRKKQLVRILTVTDLHQSRCLYDQLQAEVHRHQPDLVAVIGDFLDLADDQDLPMTKAECARVLAGLSCPEVLLVRGNHESGHWPLFVASWPQFRSRRILHAAAFALGPAVVVGFPCQLGDAFHYLEGGEAEQGPVEDWFPAIAKTYGSASRFLWLMHEPPIDTGLSAQTGALAGNSEWRQAIEQYAPQVVVFGHDHHPSIRRSQWHTLVHQTNCVNVGQKLDGPLHYCVIEAEFPTPAPCLPWRTQLTAYPWEQSITIDRGR